VSDNVEKRFEPDIHTYMTRMRGVGNAHLDFQQGD